ncbi:ribonuclease HI family protein [Patescibacteria group bacterium]|nr:ribonuclease HI family protein [Patescibacteria group bacterium]
MKQAIMHADGGARGNPGPAGAGAILHNNEGIVLAELSEYMGVATNNQAEYRGVVIGLKKAKELGIEELKVFLYSELIVKQINGEYKVRNAVLAKYFLEVYNLKQSFRIITFSHVPRAKNADADRLVNQAIDSAINL